MILVPNTIIFTITWLIIGPGEKKVFLEFLILIIVPHCELIAPDDVTNWVNWRLVLHFCNVTNVTKGVNAGQLDFEYLVNYPFQNTIGLWFILNFIPENDPGNDFDQRFSDCTVRILSPFHFLNLKLTEFNSEMTLGSRTTTFPNPFVNIINIFSKFYNGVMGEIKWNRRS